MDSFLPLHIRRWTIPKSFSSPFCQASPLFPHTCRSWTFPLQLSDLPLQFNINSRHQLWKRNLSTHWSKAVCQRRCRSLTWKQFPGMCWERNNCLSNKPGERAGARHHTHPPSPSLPALDSAALQRKGKVTWQPNSHNQGSRNILFTDSVNKLFPLPPFRADKMGHYSQWFPVHLLNCRLRSLTESRLCSVLHSSPPGDPLICSGSCVLVFFFFPYCIDSAELLASFFLGVPTTKPQPFEPAATASFTLCRTALPTEPRNQV